MQHMKNSSTGIDKHVYLGRLHTYFDKFRAFRDNVWFSLSELLTESPGFNLSNEVTKAISYQKLYHAKGNTLQ